MRGWFLVFCLTLAQAAPLVPVEGPEEAEFENLPEQYEANPVFIVPRLQKPVALPSEVTTFEVPKLDIEPTPETPKPETHCETGSVNVVTNQGKSHFFDYTCETTAGEVLSKMQAIGIVPPETALGSGLFVSTKGFFHEPTIDTLKPSELLINHSVHNNGMLFITIACPVATVYFEFDGRVFPQVLNCTTTIDYVNHLFLRISGVYDVKPTFSYANSKGVVTQVDVTIPVLAQLKNVKTKIISVDYPQLASASASPLPSPSSAPSASTSPSPSSNNNKISYPESATSTEPGTIIVDSWDAQDDRNTIPEGAVPLGGGSLVQQSTSQAEEMKKYRRIFH